MKKSKTADAMFDEMNFTKSESKLFITYSKELDDENGIDRDISFHILERIYTSYFAIAYSKGVNPKEHLAIHQKLIELGWID